jgi:hypothetical protein
MTDGVDRIAPTLRHSNGGEEACERKEGEDAVEGMGVELGRSRNEWRRRRSDVLLLLARTAVVCAIKWMFATGHGVRL